ncbi:N-6 DNA methylase [Actinomadura sp. NPDC000929]|uniref:Eco57I restriction-modification methylase domain-containing protein n=1 Tax=Actinomadura sp. NPDC000929 TaxID=3154517 RepID=UPI0033972CF2
MKVSDEVSAEKLRGGFYSPAGLVKVCLDRVADLLGDRREIRLLEPSAGNGAFLRGTLQHPLKEKISQMTLVEIVESEAELCRQSATSASLTSSVLHGSFLSEIIKMEPTFDAAVGNPPFVRFQFVDPTERRHAEAIATQLGVTLRGVSNLWIPILYKAIASLNQGGAFAFIVPAECLTGISAADARRWLLRNTKQLRIDLFLPGSFPTVLQEVVVISGVKTSYNPRSTHSVTVVDHDSSTRIWDHSIFADEPTWTKLLMSPTHVSALDEASSLPGCIHLGGVAKFSVATVTGANDFFSVDETTIKNYELEAWARPLLPRIRNAPGLRFTADDFLEISKNQIKSYLLDFSSSAPDPMLFEGPREYLEQGEGKLLHKRYKCRIRSPWYRVPVVSPGDLLLSKRSHHYPRVVLNEKRAITTDTIYQAKLAPTYSDKGTALTAGFHNSLTLLSAEIEGRSFGGGVLELVPSEVARLKVFVSEQLTGELESLDKIARSSAPEREDLLVEETDRRLSKAIGGLNDSLMTSLAEARASLQRRRHDRSSVGS